MKDLPLDTEREGDREMDLIRGERLREGEREIGERETERGAAILRFLDLDLD